MSKLAAALLLLLALAPLAWMVFGRHRPKSGPRFPRMVRRHWLRFGLPAIVLLGATGQWRAFSTLPTAFAPAAAWAGIGGLAPGEQWRLIGSAATGIAAGIVGGVALTAWRAWRGRPEGSLFGDASAVRPQPGEYRWAALLAATAGVTEEAYFRLLLPLFATQAGVPAVAAFAGAALLFGAAHRYQGWRGVVATTLAGVALTLAYLATASLFAVMAFHALGDLAHLVLRPAVRAWVLGRHARRRGTTV